MSYSSVMKKSRPTQEAFGPPVHQDELTVNLSVLERKLNTDMKCPAGKNQVYLRSLMTGSGTTRPRVALKCPLRRDIGEKPEVFYEHIRDVCCGDHSKCPAWQSLKDRYVAT